MTTLKQGTRAGRGAKRLVVVVLFTIICHSYHKQVVDLAYPTGEGACLYNNQSAFDIQSLHSLRVRHPNAPEKEQANVHPCG